MTDKNVKEKRFSMSSEEREEFKNLQRIFDDIYYQQQGMKMLMDDAVKRAIKRCGIQDEDVAKGMTRKINFDPSKYEIVVVELPEVKEAPSK